jgi:dihydroorotate dehydrogenase electron transfer subunit
MQGNIVSNTNIAKDVFRMEIGIHLDAQPGQFVQIQVPGYYLRRPISICELKDDSFVIIYKVLGSGTDVLSKMKAGEMLDVVGPLGTGFPIEDKDPVLIGGGVGVPPLYETAKRYKKADRKVTVVLGFNTKADAFYLDEFKELGANVHVATMDGSLGTCGTVIDAINESNIRPNFVLACGPTPMLRAVNQAYTGYISLEARMACGIGACMGCVVPAAAGGNLRVCKDGPVFKTGEVIV